MRGCEDIESRRFSGLKLDLINDDGARPIDLSNIGTVDTNHFSCKEVDIPADDFISELIIYWDTEALTQVSF